LRCSSSGVNKTKGSLFLIHCYLEIYIVYSKDLSSTGRGASCVALASVRKPNHSRLLDSELLKSVRRDTYFEEILYKNGGP
jgi:hypothetical protein